MTTHTDADGSFLIRGGIVLPMEGRKTYHDPGSVLVVDGTIAAVGSVTEVARHPAAAGVTVIDADRHAVIPGIHNCHLHSGLLRGTAESLALWEWLENHIDPAHRALTPEIAEAASWMAYTEGLRGGTLGADMWLTWRICGARPRRWHRATRPPTPPTSNDYLRNFEDRTAGCWRRTGGRRRRVVPGWLEHIFVLLAGLFRGAADCRRVRTGIHTHTWSPV